MSLRLVIGVASGPVTAHTVVALPLKYCIVSDVMKLCEYLAASVRGSTNF